MYCQFCGTQLHEEAKFCHKCGKEQKIGLPSQTEQSTRETAWEYWIWDAKNPSNLSIRRVKKFKDEAGQRDGMTELEARLHFWHQIQSRVLSIVRKLQDDGWEPIGEVGPGAIKLNTLSTKDAHGSFFQSLEQFPL